jgi:hypothetical protein
MRILVMALVTCGLAAQVFGHSNYTGRSGAPGRQTCASSCHGNPGGTVTISGFPASYTPDQNYLLTISRLSGDPIQNFNTSCRVGVGTTNAGVIAAGTGTSVYNVAGETNGVHLTADGQTSATFNWTAPAVGTGTVRLYTGAFQGTDPDLGSYSTLVLVADEAVATPPDAPQNLVIKPVASNLELNWSASAGAGSYNIYRDLTAGFVPAPGNLIATVPVTTYADTEVIPPPALRFYVVTAVAP